MTRRLNGVVGQLRWTALAQTARPADAELLDAFIAHGDEAAFAALLQRHGPMVFGVCRRILANDADAEDAFQATFLVLVQKAASIVPRSMFANWLYGVAQRVALKARTMSGKRRAKEKQARTAQARACDRELQEVLDQELVRLPDKYRQVIVKCELEGWSLKEAARELGCPPGTLASRLARGRNMLARRLARHGLTLPGAALATLAPGWALAAAPASLQAATLRAAALVIQGKAAVVSAKVLALTQGAIRAMFVSKLKTLAALALVTLLLGFAGSWMLDGQAVEKAQPGTAVAPEDKAAAKDIRTLVREVAAVLKKSPIRRVAGQDTLGLYLMDLKTSDVTLIAGEPDAGRGYCGTPSWSKDGGRILFDASPGMDFRETRVQQLEVKDGAVGLRGFGPGNCPTLSPDGKRIAFHLNEGAIAGARSGIYVMNADGTERRWLGGGGVPMWSPDGRSLLTAGFGNPCPLALIDVESGERRDVQGGGMKTRLDKFYFRPSWVENNTIVASIHDAKSVLIALVDVSNPAAATVKEIIWKRGDGTNVEPLYPVYSPHSRLCVFVGRDKKGQALYSVEPGKLPRRLEAERYDTKIASLAFSPGGEYLLFASDRP